MPDAPTPTPAKPTLNGVIQGHVLAGDKAVPHAVLTLDDSAAPGGPSDPAKFPTFTTDAAGAYHFAFLPVATFKVSLAVPAGYSLVGSSIAAGNPVPIVVDGLCTPANPKILNFTLAPLAPPAAATPTPTPAPTAPPPVTPPVVVPPVPVPPVPTPVPAVAGIFCGTGATASPTTNYAGTAPFIAVLSAAQFTGTRTHRRQWHLATGAAKIADPRAIADPVKYAAPVPIDDGYIGQTTAAVYEQPGTYTARLDVTNPDGTTSHYPQTITVGESPLPRYYFGPGGNDANAGTVSAPFASANKLASLVAKGNAWCTGLPNTVYQTPVTLPFPVQIGGTINVGSNVVVDAVDEAQPLPTFMLGANGAFFVGRGVSNVLLRGLRFDSVGTKLGNFLAAPVVGSGRAEAIINNGGTSIALLRCRFGCLDRIGEHNGGDATIFIGCVQERPDNVHGQGIAAFGFGRIVVLRCALLQCWAEAVFRMSNVGVGANCAVEGNLLAQMMPQGGPTSDKSPLDIRTCPGGFVSANNAIVNGTTGLSDGHGAASVTDVLMEGDSYYTTDGISPASQFLVINGKVSGVTLRGLTFPVMPKTLAAASITPGAGVGDIVFDGCSTPAGMALHNLPAGQTVARVTGK